MQGIERMQDKEDTRAMRKRNKERYILSNDGKRINGGVLP